MASWSVVVVFAWSFNVAVIQRDHEVWVQLLTVRHDAAVVNVLRGARLGGALDYDNFGAVALKQSAAVAAREERLSWFHHAGLASGRGWWVRGQRWSGM